MKITSIAEAVKILQPKNVEIILVTSSTKGGRYVGIVTDSDILEKVVMKGDDSDLVFLKSIMTSPIITLPSSATVKQDIELMRSRKIKHLPVTGYYKQRTNYWYSNTRISCRSNSYSSC